MLAGMFASGRARVAGAVVVSAVLHVVFARGLPEKRDVERVSGAAEVSLEIVAVERVEAPPAVVVIESDTAKPKVRPPLRGPVIDEEPRDLAASVRVDGSEIAAGDLKNDAEIGAPATIDLSPRAVARAASDRSAGAALSCAALHADAGAQCEVDSDGDDNKRLRAANERLELALEAAANDGLRSIAEEKPKLERASDGSYRFEGRGFVAKIERDGTVQLEDRPAVQIAPIPIGGTFDLTEAIEGGLLGRELHGTEKRWFLAQTASLRGELAKRERERARLHGRSNLERELVRLASDTSRSLEARHAEIFALWDDCEADEHGSAAQELIERFVRSAMPEGSASSFAHDELEALNRGRVSKRRFDPYVNEDAGTRPG